MILWFLVWYVVMYVGYICVDICIKRLAHRAKRFKLKVLIYIHLCLCVGAALLWGIVYLGWYLESFFAVGIILGWLRLIAMWLVHLLGVVLFLRYRALMTAALAGKR